MKKLITAATLVALVVLLTAARQSFAQSGTLVLYASTDTLNTVIGGDTTSTGQQKHAVYQLVSLDTTYLFDGTVTSKSGIQIVGVPDPSTGRLPCVQPAVLSDGSLPGTFFACNGTGANIVFKNLYLLGIATDNTVNYGGGQAVQLSADSIKFTADNVVFEQWSQFAIGYQGSWDKIFVTNCKFRNMTTLPNQWYVGEAIRNENYVGAFPTDSIVMKYNTMLCVSGYATAATGGIVNYYEFSHNDVIYTFKNPFFLDRMVNAKFDNNIFYNAYAGGENKTEYAGWDSFTPNTGPSIITMGPLDSLTAARLLGHSITTSADSAAAEAARKVEVKNNDYYWSSGLTSFWTAWNDTAHVDSIYTPTFMNAVTEAMFSNATKWPGFVQSGNQNVDPGFGASINAVLNSGVGNGDGLLNWFTAVRTGVGTTQTYGYQITQVGSAANWTPAWPLHEATDLQYTNASLKGSSTDGKPLGDPYWFNGLQSVKTLPGAVPTKFELSNNYPNPFNPSTDIKVSLAHAGVISLTVYNVLGQVVDVVDQGYKPAGQYLYNVNMDRFASGVYFYSLRQGTNVITKKMLLLK